MKVSRRFSLIVSQIFAEDISLNLNYLRNSADFSAYICEKEKSLFSQPLKDNCSSHMKGLRLHPQLVHRKFKIHQCILDPLFGGLARTMAYIVIDV